MFCAPSALLGTTDGQVVRTNNHHVVVCDKEVSGRKGEEEGSIPPPPETLRHDLPILLRYLPVPGNHHNTTNIMSASSASNLPPPADNVSRHTLVPESELRIEIPPGISSTVTLRAGSAEIFGAELALGDRPLHLTAAKVAIFTWHGCTLDVSNQDQLDIIYVSDETDANVAFVNTHAQLEAMRDEALGYSANTTVTTVDETNKESAANGVKAAGGEDFSGGDSGGPRVLLVGPADCGKSSLARILTAYAVKLGRTPLLVDLDTSQNMLSVPGTIAAIPVSSDMISADSYGTISIMGGSTVGAMMPLVLWYGSQDLTAHPDLYKAQLTKLGTAIDERLSGDADANASGIIVNTSGLIEEVGYQYLLHAIDSFRINVVLVLGHDRLYSMLGTQLKKEEGTKKAPILIKLPRSGGVVSRDSPFRRILRSQSIKRYFYGNSIPPKSTDAPSSTLHYQFSPCLIEVRLSDVQIHTLSNISLSASLLPISAKQSTDPIQLSTIASSEITSKFQHSILAVCHPSAVEKYEQSGSARDLYLAGVAGFVLVEKVDVDKASMSLLSPCGGSLPTGHMLVGDIFWME
jgi:polyribonucleotide 5'-hydroxyl-kinase